MNPALEKLLKLLLASKAAKIDTVEGIALLLASGLTAEEAKELKAMTLLDILQGITLGGIVQIAVSVEKTK